jgi:F0F1-type ATP synthase membrane subunit c/vacuolar-type H+-ATPase subunit K
VNPNWTDILSALAAVLAVGLAAVGGWVAVVQLRIAARALELAADQLSETRLTSLTQVMTELTRRWDEPVLKDSRDALAGYSAEQLRELVERVYTRGGDTEARKKYFVLAALPNFLESVAIMCRRGLSVDLVDDLWGSAIVNAWRSWRPATEFARERLQTETIYLNLENLAEEIARRRGGAPSVTPSAPD